MAGPIRVKILGEVMIGARAHSPGDEIEVDAVALSQLEERGRAEVLGAAEKVEPPPPPVPELLPGGVTGAPPDTAPEPAALRKATPKKVAAKAPAKVAASGRKPG